MVSLLQLGTWNRAQTAPRLLSEELGGSVATGCPCPGLTWLRPCGPQACRAVLRQSDPAVGAAALASSGSGSPSTIWLYKGLFNSDCWQTLQRKAFFVRDRQCLCSDVGTSRCKLLRRRVQKAPLGLSYPFGWEDEKRIKYCM